MIFSKVKNYFLVCMNKMVVENCGVEFFNKFIYYVGFWIIINVFDVGFWFLELWNFELVFSRIYKLKSMFLFYMFVLVDDWNLSYNII